MSKHKHQALCLLPCLLALLLCAACGGEEGSDAADTSQDTVVLEPGLPDDTATDPIEEDTDPDDADEQQPEEFTDLGAAATLEDLTAAQAKIQSYYFEQTMPYLDSSVFMQVWYKDGYMRMRSSVDGYGLTENYYNYWDSTITSYSPGSGGPAQRMQFDFSSVDAPDNPAMEDYSLCTLLGTESIGGQTCLVLETPEGDTLWVGTKYGFPLQVEFTDSLGDHFTVTYDNIEINTLEDADVLPPDDMEIKNVSGM